MNIDHVNGDLEGLSDEELLKYAREVVGTDPFPKGSSIPYAFRRLAAMIDKLRNPDETNP